jgi:hypothetical protein
MAVWLCELRLWLSIVIESDESDPMRITPLPNLDRHIRVGDSLAGGAFDDPGSIRGSRKLASLRSRYMRATGPRKPTLARELDRLERSAAIDALARTRVRLSSQRREILMLVRGRDLFDFGISRIIDPDPTHWDSTRIREATDRVRALSRRRALPFSFSAHLSDIAATGGFDVVIGNPPWVRVHRIAELARG